MDTVVVTKVKHVLATIAVVFVMFGLITWQVRSLTEDQRESDARDAALVAYQTQIEVYSGQVNDREICLSTVALREIYRDRFQGTLTVLDDFADIIDLGAGPEHDGLIQDLHDTVEEERETLAGELERLSVRDCPPIPPRPLLDPTVKSFEDITRVLDQIPDEQTTP